MSASARPDRSKTVVFFDGDCGLCSREIAHYLRLDHENWIRWVDINKDQVLLNDLGISFEHAMRRMHVVGKDGVVRDGVCAFLAMWQELPYHRFLPGIIKALRLVPVMEFCYSRFARWRYERRQGRAVCPAP